VLAKSRKLALTILLTLLFLAIAAMFDNFAVANPSPVQPDTSILIGVDGSVNGTDRILREGNVYRFTGNILNNITISKSDIIIDGAGFTLQGKGDAYGFWIRGESNITIKNLKIENFTYGIWAWDCQNIVITRNTIASNHVGIELSCLAPSNDSISGNTIKSNDSGIIIASNSSTFIAGNRIEANNYGLGITGTAQNSRIYHNSFINNTFQVSFHPYLTSIFEGRVLGLVAWDDGYRGNYWSDFQGVDDNTDGIGDSAYVIKSDYPEVGDCRDRFPLITPSAVMVEAPDYSPLDESQYDNCVNESFYFYLLGAVVAVGAGLAVFALVLYKKKKSTVN
jgi:nitrous oxidase accessory protein NosD